MAAPARGGRGPRWQMDQVMDGTLHVALAALSATALGVHHLAGLSTFTVIAVGSIGGAVLGAVGGRTWARVLGGVALGALLLAAFAPGTGRLVHGLAREDPLPPAPADAIVVLAGSVSPDGRLGAEATDRLLEGIRLARRGAAPRIVVSRVATSAGGRRVTSDADVAYLLETAGLDTELHTLDPVHSTRTEAERFAELARRSGWRSAIVVTSPLHTRRACAAFAQLGVVVHCRLSPSRSFAWQSLAGPSDRVAAVGGWLYENLGWTEYRIRGWVR